MRVQKVASGNASKVMRIRDVRKSIARVLTVITQSQRNQLRILYAGQKYVPLDLRPKLTRAMRRRLSPADAARMTSRQHKRKIHFPLRKFAIKA